MKTGENMLYNDNIDVSRCMKSEDMLILKAKTMKECNKTYKFLECIEDVLKINPYNQQALKEIAIYLREG